MMTMAVGIDLGTINSVIAQVDRTVNKLIL